MGLAYLEKSCTVMIPSFCIRASSTIRSSFKLIGMYTLAIHSSVVFRNYFHPDFSVYLNINSVSGENVMIFDQDIYNCLLFCYCYNCVSPIKSFEEFVSGFCAPLWFELSFLFEFNSFR